MSGLASAPPSGRLKSSKMRGKRGPLGLRAPSPAKGSASLASCSSLTACSLDRKGWWAGGFSVNPALSLKAALSLDMNWSVSECSVTARFSRSLSSADIIDDSAAPGWLLLGG